MTSEEPPRARPDAVIESNQACRLCGTMIPHNSRICHTCKRHQNKFWDLCRNIPVFITLLTAILSGVLFSYGRVNDIVRKWTWEDNVELWKLDTSGQSMFRNIGDGDVFLSAIKCEYDDHSQSFQIGEILERGSLRPFSPGYSPLGGQAFHPMSTEEIEEGKKPSFYVFLSKDSDTLSSWRDLWKGVEKKLSEGTGTGTLVFFPLRNNERKESVVECIVVPILFDWIG